jgi:hypothetical protein
MRTLRRFLLLFALMFWQGGLMVYGVIVVPIARGEFHDHLDRQAHVTSRVTDWLNLLGAVALGLWLWDMWATRDPRRRRQHFRMGCWLLLLFSLAVLERLHRRLDGQMREPAAKKEEEEFRQSFHFNHRAYLLVTTAQWLAAMALLTATLRAWQDEDAAPGLIGARSVSEGQPLPR